MKHHLHWSIFPAEHYVMLWEGSLGITCPLKILPATQGPCFTAPDHPARSDQLKITGMEIPHLLIEAEQLRPSEMQASDHPGAGDAKVFTLWG